MTGVTTHGPYTGPAPTTTGAVSNSPAGTVIPMLPPNPTALRYDPNGELNDQEPIPYQPAGGLGTNGTEPVYRVQSDFDYESVLLGLYQEWIELDLFHDILARFSVENFTAAGLTESDRFLIEFMADQETGHATLLSNLLGGPGGATPQCSFPSSLLQLRIYVNEYLQAHTTTLTKLFTKLSTFARNSPVSVNLASGVSKHISIPVRLRNFSTNLLPPKLASN